MDYKIDISQETLTINANKVKEIVLDRLFKDELIDADKHNEYKYSWQIIVVQCGWFKNWFNKFIGESEDRFMFKLVRFEDND